MGAGLGVLVGEKVWVGSGVFVMVGVSVFVGVNVGVGVSVKVCVGVKVGVRVIVGVNVRVGVDVREGVYVGLAIVPCAQCCGVSDAVAVGALLKSAFAEETLRAKKEMPIKQMRRNAPPKYKGRRFFFFCGGGEGFARFTRGVGLGARCGELFSCGGILRLAHAIPFWARGLFGLICNAFRKN